MFRRYLRKIALRLEKKSYRTKRIIEGIRFKDHVRFYNKECYTQKTDEKLVLFESFFGKKYADSPKAIYLEMLNNPAYSEYRFVWIFRRREISQKQEYVDNERTTVLPYHSRECWMAYGKAKYWVLNSRVQGFIKKRPDQVFIQTWHGTPLKRLGFDIKKGNNVNISATELSQHYLENARKADFFLSPSRFCTEVFTTAFGFDQLGMEDKLIETGYPRNDELFRLTPEKIKSIKETLAIPKDKKVILYAPTWRDNQHELGVGYTFDAVSHIEKLLSALPEDYVMIVRLHYFIANQIDISRFEGKAYDYSNYEDINHLYAISDILITDYSSVFFDYANLHRPILFYMYDLEMYKNEMRDFYIDLNELPGPILKTQTEVIQAINEIESIEEEYKEKYKAFNERFNYLDDSNASLRVIQKCITKEGV